MKYIFCFPITHKKISAVLLFVSHNPINLSAVLPLEVAGLFFLFSLCAMCFPYQKVPVLLQVTEGEFKGMLEDHKDSPLSNPKHAFTLLFC